MVQVGLRLWVIRFNLHPELFFGAGTTKFKAKARDLSRITVTFPLYTMTTGDNNSLCAVRWTSAKIRFDMLVTCHSGSWRHLGPLAVPGGALLSFLDGAIT